MSKKWEAKQVNLSGAIVFAVVACVFGIFVGVNWNNFAADFLPYLGFRSTKANDWSALDEVYNALSSNYDGEIDYDTIVEGAKAGLVAAVGDQYTNYMTAQEASEFQDSLHGNIGAGIGIELGLRENYVRVIRTLPDNPAREAGVLAGDIIYKVNDEDVYSETTDVIASKLRGEAGTSVKLTVVRDGEEKSFTLVRETINNVSAYAEYDGQIAIITLTRFDNDTGTIVSKIVNGDDYRNRNINKVILDLRGNGGGYVSAAKDILSLWIDGEAILQQRGVHAGNTTTFANKGQAVLANTKTIVLINGNSASASEIVAGALQDYEKATIVGETSYGKGVVQTMLSLSAGSMLKVTTARWYTPLGTTINEEGIKPDVEVEKSYADTNAGRDPQLDKAKQL